MPATRCSVCGKGPVFGHQISHAHNVSTRKRYPNIQQVRAVLGGRVKRIAVCTRCLRSGRIRKTA